MGEVHVFSKSSVGGHDPNCVQMVQGQKQNFARSGGRGQLVLDHHYHQVKELVHAVHIQPHHRREHDALQIVPKRRHTQQRT